ncbi:MAG: WD40/YVTN/BNR-like repeat-containing protein [Candidatus Binatia bacterium]
MRILISKACKRLLTLPLLVVLATAGCEKRAEPPPAFNVFGVTDKFFDVKSLGGGSFIALAYRSKILRSDDAGATWQVHSRPWKRSLTRLSFIDAKRGWGVGHEGKIFVTTDGGKTWSEQKSNTEGPLFDLDFVDDQHGFAVGDLSSFLSTADGGKTWTAQKIPMSMIGVREDMSLAISDPIFYGVDFIDANTGWVSGEFGQIRITEDGGKTWGAQHGTLLGGKIRDIMTLPTLLCIRFRDRQNGLAVGTYGAIVTTADGGATWKFEDSPVTEPLYDIRYMPDGDALIVGSSGNILRGTPGQKWASANVPVGVYSWISAVDFDVEGRGVAGGGHGLILTSSDFGKSWQQTIFQ